MSTTISEQLSRLDRFIVQHTPIQNSSTIITTVNRIATIALYPLLYCIGSQICRKWPQSWIAIGLSAFSLPELTPTHHKLWATIGVLLQCALQISMTNSVVVNILSNRFPNQNKDSFYDRASYLNIYEQMLNTSNNEHFFVYHKNGPLDKYISISADVIAKNRGVDRQEILNQQNSRGDTWLHWAVSEANASLFEKLLDMGMDLSIGRPDTVIGATGKMPETRMCFRPLDEALRRGRAEYLKVAFRKHLSSGCRLLNEAALKSFINTLSQHNTNRTPITDFRDGLIELFKQDSRARELLEEKIYKLVPFVEDKSLQKFRAYMVPTPGLLDSLYRESAPTAATFD